MSKKVLILMGSDSDFSVMSEAGKTLEEFNVEYEITVSSAHRSPERTKELVSKAKDEGVKVIIASAGLAAHLAGVVAAHFHLPVIGVPIQSGPLSGLDALLSTMQMPPGVPVATVAINGAKNAAVLAVQILATSDGALENSLIEYKKKLADAVEEKARNLGK
ncbi:MAG: Phosphoribosylamine-glycine ligase [Candidatus Daviesbacteria bacterium GW2011_GWB1_39_5]|nr:MAG: Phosphoribosylamine-glycine ligase [Candidatus Daviesbacteria bacterium GW2011_GWB1_39_5]OGE21767.1 MAG: 5-(carboxyamino)imidazole ribonucleotide mutase [Candidatus Daviesbacteria bacterium RIFCSPHIGHO2_01_FULL_40_24]OGE29439.1 MAG: 5-(carboxyamino)imidazole ribonucleotide mutase [Candidatus Daviesbacteria bacterium RIFCSPHIGHO2_02_FULL_40_16]OGE42541.1 MAG: 5-(carboxyamino)imidazole ribonucleotide mutase [Candidatus Daviesbacteria bacterium RIFCSPLOWO2_01_FULL_39_23]OGE66000.1 MAG: 5-(